MTKRERARQHEEYVARLYGGHRSASSGGSIVDKGDVDTRPTKYECKVTGEPGRPANYTTVLRHLEKVADEAWEEGKDPALCLRYFLPDSPLAARDGWVDLTVRLSEDDARRGNGDQA